MIYINGEKNKDKNKKKPIWYVRTTNFIHTCIQAPAYQKTDNTVIQKWMVVLVVTFTKAIFTLFLCSQLSDIKKTFCTLFHKISTESQFIYSPSWSMMFYVINRTDFIRTVLDLDIFKTKNSTYWFFELVLIFYVSNHLSKIELSSANCSLCA